MALAPTNDKSAKALSQATPPASSLQVDTASASRPGLPTPSPGCASEGTLEAPSANKIAHESTVKFTAVDSQQANVSPIAVSSPVDGLPAAVDEPSEPDVERSFTREGLLRFLPRLREQLPKDLFAQVEAFVHTEEEEDQPSSEQDVTAHKDSTSVAQESLSPTTRPRAVAFAEQTHREPTFPSKAITLTKPKSLKGADALTGPSAPPSIVEDSASIEHPSVQSPNLAAALLGPTPAQRAEDQAEQRKGMLGDSPSKAVISNDSKATSLPQESQQATASMRSGRQSLAQSLKRQRDALIGEHVHKSRFSHNTASLEKQFARLRISETNASQGPLQNTPEVSTSASNVASHRRVHTLPSFLQAIQRQSDSGAAARNQYSGNNEPRTSRDPTGFRPEASRREKTRSISSSTTDSLSFPPSRITPRTGEGPDLPEFLRPVGPPSGSQPATHAAPVVPSRFPLKENQNPFARRPTNPNVAIGSQPLASLASTNASISSTPPHLKSRRTKTSGPDLPNFLQEALAAQTRNGAN